MATPSTSRCLLFFLLTSVLAVGLVPVTSITRCGAAASAVTQDSIPEYPINVTGERVTLREIIQRSLEGERTKLGGHHNMTYTMTVRNMVQWTDKMKVEDKVLRAYSDADGNNRTIVLDETKKKFNRVDGEWVRDKKDESKTDANVSVSVGGIEDFANIPFFLEDEHEFDFTLLERTLDVDHVIFKIGFKPKSDFKALPSGIVYVNTDNYRIIHEEFTFEKNPYPLFLNGVDRVSRHWTVLPGGEWVFTKVLLDVDIKSDPFGYMPKKVSAALIRDNFQFDKGYDARLFGNVDIDTPGARAAAVTNRDSDAGIKEVGLLDHLQAEDSAFFPHELFNVDRAHRDRVVAQHDSLGLDGFEDALNRRMPMLRRSLGLATNLWDYNRVEGLVVGLSGQITGRHADEGWRLKLEGAYATGSDKFRHYERLTLPWERSRWRVELHGQYADKVVPYGSNRPALNGVRMLVGSEDRQDYLRRQGGGGGVLVEHPSGLSVNALYEVNRLHSVMGTTDFSFFGDLSLFNAPIDEGIERAAVAAIGWEGSGLNLDLTQRIAGGEMRGDFDFARTDVHADLRHYLIGRHEVFAEVNYAVTGGNVPVQHLADVGGLSTIRGYRRRTLVGESSVSARAEYFFPYDLLGDSGIPVISWLSPQLVPWVDAGRVWDGNSEDWLHSVGFGIQYFLGGFGDASNLRFDFSFPTGPDAGDDFRVDLRFTAGDF